MSMGLLPSVIVAGVCLAFAPTGRPVAAVSGNPSEPLSASPLPTAERFAELARTNPVAMLKACVDRCATDLRGYRAVMTKQERIGGKLYPEETIRVACREAPQAVLMVWEKGARLGVGAEIKATVYAVGEPEPMMVYRPKALFARFQEAAADPRGRDARKAARSGIEESGLSQIVKRTHSAWAAVEKRGELNCEYLGVERKPETGNRPCHVIRRTSPRDEIDPFVTGEPPVEVTDANRADSFRTVTIWIDCETWLQLGTEQKRHDGELTARYFFNITETNPTFGKDQFTLAAAKR